MRARSPAPNVSRTAPDHDDISLPAAAAATRPTPGTCRFRAAYHGASVRHATNCLLQLLVLVPGESPASTGLSLEYHATVAAFASPVLQLRNAAPHV